MQTVVDVSRLRHNIRIIRVKTGNRFCAVVKADAYGHGIAVAPFIEPLCDCFFVATADEALTLSASVKKPILVGAGDISPLIKDFQPQLIPTVCDVSQLRGALNAGYKRFSVALNTGMNRAGADEARLDPILSLCKQLDISPWSVYSHIYDGIYSLPEQTEKFEYLTRDAIMRNNRHLYGSLAIELKGYDLYDTVRVGLAMYGYGVGVEPCMRARAKIVSQRFVCKGEHVGYGGYTLERDSVIATVACGYADGVRRCAKQLYFRVRGKKCPVIGRPCMDSTMIDVSGVGCGTGEFAYFIDGREDAEYLATCYGTIVYEVLTGFNGRNERIYI